MHDAPHYAEKPSKHTRDRLWITLIELGVASKRNCDTHTSNRFVTSISAFPFPIEPSVRMLFAEKRKIRIVPIGMCQVPIDWLSLGTVILPRSKHIDWCLSHPDLTSRSNVIREHA